MKDKLRDEIRAAVLTYIQATGCEISDELKRLTGISDKDYHNSIEIYKRYIKDK